jgi:hypothetical protein
LRRTLSFTLMKNWAVAESGTMVRAMERALRWSGRCRLVLIGPGGFLLIWA